MHLGRKLRRELRKACDYNPLTCLKTFAHPSRGNRMAHTRWYEKGNPQYLVLGHENWYWHFAQGGYSVRGLCRVAPHPARLRRAVRLSTGHWCEPRCTG